MKIGRNDPCPCGSGRKFKHCCGALNAEPRASGAETRASGENLFRLASVHHASGRLGEAERCYRQILKASGTRPDSPMPHFNLGVVLEEQGRLDEANLSPGTGGLMIWDKEAPHDWDFEAYNRTPERIRDYLRESNAAQVVVPYKQNRVVVFNSDLFHKTDGIHFLQGYENRRINVTLLYGRREDA